jgi:serine/threonine-protein phosphatase 2B catalytic subunit
VPNAQFLKAHFFDEGKLSEEQVCRLVEAGTELLAKEPNLLRLPAPITSKQSKNTSF